MQHLHHHVLHNLVDKLFSACISTLSIFFPFGEIENCKQKTIVGRTIWMTMSNAFIQIVKFANYITIDCIRWIWISIKIEIVWIIHVYCSTAFNKLKHNIKTMRFLTFRMNIVLAVAILSCLISCHSIYQMKPPNKNAWKVYFIGKCPFGWIDIKYSLECLWRILNSLATENFEPKTLHYLRMKTISDD